MKMFDAIFDSRKNTTVVFCGLTRPSKFSLRKATRADLLRQGARIFNEAKAGDSAVRNLVTQIYSNIGIVMLR